MPEQNYENYWKLTLEYTNFNDVKFLRTLQIVVDKIDNLNSSNDYVYDREDYKSLQHEVLASVPKTATNINDQLASTRKAINQCVKLGFIEPQLRAYHRDTRMYLEARTNRKRNTLLSKIIYSNAKFNSSITNIHTWSQINFLLKTLEEVGQLKKVNIIGLMNIEITEYTKGYVTIDELTYHTNIARNNGFIERKYNQVQYLFNLLKKLDDVVFINDILYFEEDAKVIFGEDLKQETRKRDGYLHRIYKNQLQEEIDEKCGKTVCMIEKLAYPSLVASHIKPFIDSNDLEAYDSNNGLLLSRNIDILFDQGYISFEDDGTIICANTLDNDVKRYLEKYTLGDMFLNNARRKYLEFHREKFAQKLRSA